jgi:ABC-2 type transport system ATP-binding protein
MMAIENQPKKFDRDIITIEKLRHIYPPSRTRKTERIALHEISLSIRQGEIFSLLGPNGSGKSTLFKILSTLLSPTSGNVSIEGLDLKKEMNEIRRTIGVVFQSPSVDKKLTVGENLMHQGHLYGLRGDLLAHRIDEMLGLVSLKDRKSELVEHLSGGMQRRVELAKALLHYPRLLILDEPSTGLDPGSRKEFTNTLQRFRDEKQVTIVLTTHLLEEAEHSDRIAILDEGLLAAIGSPAELKQEIGGAILTLISSDASTIFPEIQNEFEDHAQLLGNSVKIEYRDERDALGLIQRYSSRVESITIAKPTLEDVFIHKTGHGFKDNDILPGGQGAVHD